MVGTNISHYKVLEKIGEGGAFIAASDGHVNKSLATCVNKDGGVYAQNPVNWTPTSDI